MDGMITMMISPVMNSTQTNKDEKKAREKIKRKTEKKAEEQVSYEGEFAAVYRHDTSNTFSEITYTRPGVRGYR